MEGRGQWEYAARSAPGRGRTVFHSWLPPRVDECARSTFRRDGADVFVDQEIPLKMAILGGTIEVPSIEGEIKIRIRPGTQSGTMLRLANRGINRLHGFGKGDQYVRLLIKIPQKLTRAQKEALEGL